MIFRLFKSIPIVVLVFAIAVPTILQAREPDWSAYDSILKKNIRFSKKQGVPLSKVNYRGIKADARWAGVVQMVQAFPITALKTRQEKLAFYTNAYNIAVLNLIIKRGIPTSVNNLGRGIWDQPIIRLGGRSVSLNYIEHKKLRPMGDARIHFAIVCASVSCPDLRKEAYVASRVYAQLYSQTARFLKNSAKGVRVNQSTKTVHASKLFAWFAEDFKRHGGALSFIKKYRKNIPDNYKFQTDISYNWNLNG